MVEVKAIEVAKYFVELATKSDENDLTNLKLQKLLYFAQAEYFASKGEPLFIDQIEAWEYGPVVRSVYNRYKKCGAFPISAFDYIYGAFRPLSEDHKKFLNHIWDKWGIYSASYLVNKTHEKNSVWYRHYYSDDKIIPVTELGD